MTLIVKYISDCDARSNNTWDSISEYKIACINWAEYPYQPEVSLRTLHNGDMLFIRYDVIEQYPVRVHNKQDQDPVYQDSCVEFFILDETNQYHNFECNANGVVLSARGENRNNRISKSLEELKGIIRYPSGVETIGKNYHWSLVIGIPFASVGLARGHSYRANFYKCGDLTDKKHYLSWHPINTQTPDFHCPQYFGAIEIE